MSHGAKEKAPRPGRGDGAKADSTGGKYTARLHAFLPLDLSDFETKDNELSEIELVVFLRLLKHYWLVKYPLPANDKALARVARLSPSAWRRHRPAVRRQFVETDDGWEPRLYADELRRAQKIAEKRRQAGQKGGSKSAHFRQANASSKRSSPAQAYTETDTNYYPSGVPLAPSADAPHTGSQRPHGPASSPAKKVVGGEV